MLNAIVITAISALLAVGQGVDSDLKKTNKTDKTEEVQPTKKTPVIKHREVKPRVDYKKLMEDAVSSKGATTQTENNTESAHSPQDGEYVHWSVISCSGGTTHAGSLQLASTLGQTAAGVTTVGDFNINHGYWQNFTDGIIEPCCIPPTVGDLDQSGEPLPYNVGGVDLAKMIDMLFISLTPVDCLEEADINYSGTPNPDIFDVDGVDLEYMIQTLFITLEPLGSCP